MWGTVLIWVYMGDSVKLGLCGGQCYGGLMWGTVLRWAYVGGNLLRWAYVGTVLS